MQVSLVCQIGQVKKKKKKKTKFRSVFSSSRSVSHSWSNALTPQCLGTYYPLDSLPQWLIAHEALNCADRETDRRTDRQHDCQTDRDCQRDTGPEPWGHNACRYDSKSGALAAREQLSHYSYLLTLNLASLNDVVCLKLWQSPCSCRLNAG